MTDGMDPNDQNPNRERHVEIVGLDDEKLLAVANAIRHTGNSLRLVADQSDKLAAALTRQPMALADIKRELDGFHTLCRGVTDMLSIAFGVTGGKP